MLIGYAPAAVATTPEPQRPVETACEAGNKDQHNLRCMHSCVVKICSELFLTLRRCRPWLWSPGQLKPA